MKRFFVVGYRNARNINIPDLPEEVDLDIVFERLNVGDGVYVQNDLFGNVSIFCEDDKVDFVKEFLSDYTLVEDKPSPFVPQGIPNDPLFAYQKHHEVMESQYAWDVVANDASLRVGVIDSGIWPHPDLDSNRCKITFTYNGNTYTDCYGIAVSTNSQGNPVYIPLTSLTDTRNYSIRRDNIPPEYLDDIPLYSSHGTHVAGIVAARGNNGVGVSGMMWNVRDNNNNGGIFNIFPFYDVFNSLLTFFDTLSLAAAAGCKVVNLSWGATLLNPDFNAAKMICEQIMQSAYESYGTIFVIAAGNYAIPINFGIGGMVPAACEVPNAITVTASSFGEGPTYYSNYGWKQALVGGYGGDGFYFRGTINEPDLSDPPPSMEHLKYNVLSTVGSSLDGEKLSVVKYGGANYASWAGTSMASPVVAGGLLAMLIAYKRKAGSLPDINKIRKMLKGVTSGHTVSLMQYNAAGGTYCHAYGVKAADLSGSGYNPPDISVSYSDTDNTVSITLTNNDTGFRKMVLKLSLNRYCSPYENHQENQWSFSNVPAGGSRTVSINLSDYDSSENWGLCLTSYCEIASAAKYKHTYCNKYFIPLVDECPTINSSYVEFVSTNLKAYFEEFPNVDQWENLNDANNLIDIYRLAHITLTKAYGSYMPLNGGIVALANDDGLFPREEYSIRVELTEDEVIYGLVSLYKQFMDCVEKGVLRFSAKFNKKVWYYPLDTKEYWGTGKIQRMRVPQDWLHLLENTKREDIKTIVGRIIKMCRWFSCLMGVNVVPIWYVCGDSSILESYYGVPYGAFSDPIPHQGDGGCTFIDTRATSINGDPSYTSTGSNIYHNEATYAEGVVKVTSGPFWVDTRAYPYKTGTPLWFLKCNKLTVINAKYGYCSFTPLHRNLLHKNSEEFINQYSDPPTYRGLWHDEITFVGANHGDLSIPLIGKPYRRSMHTYNHAGRPSAGLYESIFYGIDSVYNTNTNPTETNSGETFRTVTYDVYTAVSLSVLISDFVAPLRVTEWLHNQMGKHVGTYVGDETSYLGMFPNYTYTVPTTQRLYVSGRTIVYFGRPSDPVIYNKSFDWSLRVPVNNSGVDYYKLDDIVIDINPEVGFSVVRSILDKGVSLANDQATFMLHYTPKQMEGTNLSGATETHYGAAYQNVLYGEEGETFPSYSNWNLRSATNIMEPYPVTYFGLGSYTRDCGIGISFDFTTASMDWIAAPDLRGVPIDKCSDVCAYFGFQYEEAPKKFKGAVYGLNKAYKRYCVEQIPPPGYVYDKRNDRKITGYVQGFLLEKPKIKILTQRTENPKMTVSIPTIKKVVYTVPSRFKPFELYNDNYIAWVKNESGVPSLDYDSLNDLLNVNNGQVADARLIGMLYPRDPALNGKYRVVFPSSQDYLFVGGVEINGNVVNTKPLFVLYSLDVPPAKFYIPDLQFMRYEEAKDLCESLGYQIECVGQRAFYENGSGEDDETDVNKRAIVAQFPTPAMRTFPWFFNYNKKIYVLVNGRTVPFECRWLF